MKTPGPVHRAARRRGSRAVVSALVALAALAAPTEAGSNPPAQAASQEGELFAFANSDGSRLLGLEETEEPERLSRAACSSGLIEVSFRGRQHAKAADTGRAIAANFDNMPGQVFDATAGRAGGDASCLLTDAATAAQRPLIEVDRADDVECGQTLRARIESVKVQPLSGCWIKAGLASRWLVVLAQFEAGEQRPLAGLVLADDLGLAFRDFPGSDDPSSRWRVDDGGVLDPGSFELLFARQNPAGVAVAFSWAGPEGALLELVEADGSVLVPRVSGYRYWSPL